MAQIDFPPATAVGQQFTAQNGIVYFVASLNPTIWQVVDVSSSTGQRLWNRDGTENQIFPVFAGDDVVVRDFSGNYTTVITAGTGTKTASLKTDNLLFAHMPPLPA